MTRSEKNRLKWETQQKRRVELQLFLKSRTLITAKGLGKQSGWYPNKIYKFLAGELSVTERDWARIKKVMQKY